MLPYLLYDLCKSQTRVESNAIEPDSLAIQRYFDRQGIVKITRFKGDYRPRPKYLTSMFRIILIDDIAMDEM